VNAFVARLWNGNCSVHPLVGSRKKKGGCMSNPANTRDAIAMLESDHRKVEALFREFDESGDDDRREEIAARIADELEVHADLEEKIFYPALVAAFGDKGDRLVLEAVLEHGALKLLLGQLRELGAGDELFDPTMKVLKEYVQHHVREEEQEMMPKARNTDIDLDALGDEIAARKAKLLGGRGANARKGDNGVRQQSR
jgi:hemerythrin superfamily protein